MTYIARNAGGRWKTGGGATVDSKGVFRFPELADAAQHQDGTLLRKFGGFATFSAHFGLLALTITDPWVEIAGTWRRCP